MTFEEVTEIPKEPIVVLLECVLLTNGDIMFNGNKIVSGSLPRSVYRRV